MNSGGDRQCQNSITLGVSVVVLNLVTQDGFGVAFATSRDDDGLNPLVFHPSD